MKIAMLLYNDCVSDIRVHKEARDLAAAGHEVRVFATATYPDRLEREERAGYSIHRTPLASRRRTELRGSLDRVTRDRPTSLAGRLIDGMRRNRLRKLWIAERMRRRFAQGAMAAASAWSADAVHAHDLDTLDIGAALAARTGLPLVYDSHELWRANNFLLKAPRPVRNRWRRKEARLIGRADAVIITTESRADQLREWYPGVEPMVVMNCQDGESTPRTTALQDRLDLRPDVRVVLYQGLMHEDRGIFVALEALRQLPEAFVLVAIGPGGDAARFARQIEEAPYGGRAFYVPPVPHDDLASLTASAHYGLSLVQNTSLSYYLSAPNKLFEFMRAGLPMVASDFPEVQRLWSQADLGERVDPADADAVARALLALEADRARRDVIAQEARRLVHDRYNWGIQSARLLELYDRLGGS